MMMVAFSSVDIAFRDIKGKDTRLPICKLVGCPHSREISYANGLCLPNIDKPFEYLIKEAEGYRAWGFLGTKLKVGFIFPTGGPQDH
jgi:L-alanine-DL-glutamate epimerase-like enolase superfamily enzyme